MNALEKQQEVVLEFKDERQFREYVKLKKLLLTPVKTGVAA